MIGSNVNKHILSSCLRILPPSQPTAPQELVTSNISHAGVHSLNLKSVTEKHLPCAKSNTAIIFFYFLQELAKTSTED